MGDGEGVDNGINLAVCTDLCETHARPIIISMEKRRDHDWVLCELVKTIQWVSDSEKLKALC